MAAPPSGLALIFSPAPGALGDSGEFAASVTVAASTPVVWNWSSTGALPTCDVVNGGIAASITFTLTTAHFHRLSAISLEAEDGSAWTIGLEVSGDVGEP